MDKCGTFTVLGIGIYWNRVTVSFVTCCHQLDSNIQPQKLELSYSVNQLQCYRCYILNNSCIIDYWRSHI